MNKIRNQFPQLVEGIKGSEEQVQLQNAVLEDQWKAVLLAFCIGILVPVLLTLGLLKVLNWYVAGLLFFVLTGFLIHPMRILARSVEKAKVQDRKYFLSCIRAATNIEELHYAGLFGYLAGNTDEERDNSCTQIQRKLDTALAIEASEDFH